jgi:NAD(P)-dependent dehydrogenase (short-subunit alcohol dehydrogenase family)
MKIAITGHSAGIGQAFARIYEAQGHEIIGLSRRNGYNIRSLPKVAGMIEPCDMFINKAKIGYAQTELLFEVWRRWRGQQKYIVNVGTQMTDVLLPPKEEWDEYIIQKKALDLATQLLEQRSEWPRLLLVRPGSIATQPGQQPPDYMDVDEYAQGVHKWIAKNI